VLCDLCGEFFTALLIQVRDEHEGFTFADDLPLRIDAGDIEIDQIFFGAQAGNFNTGSDGFADMRGSGKFITLFQPHRPAPRDFRAEQVRDHAAEHGARDTAFIKTGVARECAVFCDFIREVKVRVELAL
jgi:hypothetical protein